MDNTSELIRVYLDVYRSVLTSIDLSDDLLVQGAQEDASHPRVAMKLFMAGDQV